MDRNIAGKRERQTPENHRPLSGAEILIHTSICKLFFTLAFSLQKFKPNVLCEGIFLSAYGDYFL